MRIHKIEHSSAIAGLGHDAKTGTLQVQFHSGQVYEYPATSEEHAALLAAESRGKHFAMHIRPKGGKRVTRDY